MTTRPNARASGAETEIKPMTASNTPDPSVSDDALASGGPAGASVEGRNSTREVLFFASYCGDDNSECSPRRPCPTCLGMSNVFRISAETKKDYVRELAPQWFPNGPPTPAGDGGFDPSKPYRTRDGREVTDLRLVKSKRAFIGILEDRTRCYWWLDGVADQEGVAGGPLDLINTPAPTVPPTPAGDRGGPVAFMEKLAQTMWGARAQIHAENDGPLDAQAVIIQDWVREEAGIVAAWLAREGARHEPVVGDGWQPIETAPKDGRPVYLAWSPEDWTTGQGHWSEGRWVAVAVFCSAGINKYEMKPFYPNPIMWRLLPPASNMLDVSAVTPSGLRIVEPSERHDGAILIADADNNDIAEFFHNEHATVGQSYEQALQLAQRLVASPASAAPTHGAGSGGEPVAYITKHGLENWMRGSGPESHVLLRAPNGLRAPLYAAPPASVDAVALVTRMRDEYGETSWKGEAANEILVALRAAQQSGEARS